jgi:hypothetical protein
MVGGAGAGAVVATVGCILPRSSASGVVCFPSLSVQCALSLVTSGPTVAFAFMVRVKVMG